MMGMKYLRTTEEVGYPLLSIARGAAVGAPDLLVLRQ